MITFVALALAIPAFAQSREEKKLADGTPYTLVKDDNRNYGVERDGRMIIPVQYRSIYTLGDLFQCNTQNEKIICDKDGSQLFSLPDDHYPGALTDKDKHTHFLEVRVAGIVGIVDLQGKLVLPYANRYVYYEAKPEGEFFHVIRTDNFHGLYSVKGDVIIPCEYNQLAYVNGYYTVIKDNFAGVFDTKGKMLVAPDTYQFATCFNYGVPYIVVKKGEYSGIIDTEGRLRIPATRYDRASMLLNGQFSVGLGIQVGICDAAGNEQFLTDEYTYISVVEKDGQFLWKYGQGTGYTLKDMQGNVVEQKKAEPKRETKSDGGFSFVDFTDVTGLCGVETTNGKTLIPPKYSYFWYYDGYFNVYAPRGGYGVFDSKGKMIVDPSRGYTSVSKVGDYYRIKRGNYEGMADSNGREIIAPNKYNSINLLSNGNFQVKIGNLLGVIDKNCREIVPVKYHDCGLHYQGKYYEVEINCRKGICDLQGREVIPPMFTDISFYEKGDYAPFDSYRVSNGKKEGIFKANGDIVFPVASYDYVRFNKIFAKDYGRDWVIEARDVEFHPSTVMYYDLDLTPLDDSVKEAEKRRNDLWEQAEDAFHAGNYASARDLYEQAGNIRWEADLAYNLGVCHYKLKNYSKAVEAADRCIQLGPSDSTRVDAYNLKGNCQNYVSSSSSTASESSSKTYSDRDALVDIAKSAYKLYRSYRKFRKTF